MLWASIRLSQPHHCIWRRWHFLVNSFGASENLCPSVHCHLSFKAFVSPKYALRSVFAIKYFNFYLFPFLFSLVRETASILTACSHRLGFGWSPPSAFPFPVGPLHPESAPSHFWFPPFHFYALWVLLPFPSATLKASFNPSHGLLFSFLVSVHLTPILFI